MDDSFGQLPEQAEAFLKRGDLQSAEDDYLDAFEILRETDGPFARRTIETKEAVACIYYTRERWEDAEHVLRNCIEERKRTFCILHPGTLKNFHNLTVLIQEHGNGEGAEPYLRCKLAGFDRFHETDAHRLARLRQPSGRGVDVWVRLGRSLGLRATRGLPPCPPAPFCEPSRRL